MYPDYNRAAEQAYRCLIRLGANALPVRPLPILRMCRDTAVYTYRQAAEHMRFSEDEFERRFGDADAFTVRRGTRYIVCYREGGNPARLNFTLAHELGHIVLKHSADNAAEEEEANCFASHLLCPEIAVKDMTPEEAARACFVSKSAAEQALNRRKGAPTQESKGKVMRQFANKIVDELL